MESKGWWDELTGSDAADRCLSEEQLAAILGE
jgi:hypothetical protein